MVEGRAFNESDRERSRKVVIVNEALAMRIGGTSAVGKRIRFRKDWMEIVGVVKDGKDRSLGERRRFAVFAPLAQNYSGEITLIARSTSDPNEVMGSLRSVVSSLDREIPIYDARSLTEHLGFALFPPRLAAIALNIFGFIALVLVATGIYGTISYAVSRRSREVAIRMALGASPANVLRLIFRQMTYVSVVAAALGCLAAVTVGGLLSTTLLSNSNGGDPASAALGVSIIAVVILAACLRPAWRAISVEPAKVLRAE
jgi:ABC-type antimicrobial peptide transport system permease subunit